MRALSFFTLLALALLAPAGAHAVRTPLPRLHIVTPGYTLTCASSARAQTIVLVCVPSRTPHAVTKSVFGNYRYGDPVPYAIFAQTAPLGNGGPSTAQCDASTITCGSGTFAVNTANAFAWTGAHTFATLTAFNGALGACASAPTTAFGWCAGGGNGTTNWYGGVMGPQACTFASGASCATSSDSTRIAWFTSLSGTGAIDACDQYVTRANVGTPMFFGCSLRTNIDFTAVGHYVSGGAVCSGTGTFTGQASSGGSTCLVTLSAGTATWTFASAWSHAPMCTGTDQTAANAVKITTTTTAATITGTSADVIAVFCWGNGQL